MGRAEQAIRRLASVLPAIERAPGWAPNYTRIACDAAETLWLTQRTDWIDVIEGNLREKVIEPDFRYPMMDGRLALARLCALQHRYDEAVDWFARARTVLTSRRRARCARSSTTTRRSCTRAGALPATPSAHDRSSTPRSSSSAPSACRVGFGAPRRC
jgi:hypothetical protein